MKKSLIISVALSAIFVGDALAASKVNYSPYVEVGAGYSKPMKKVQSMYQRADGNYDTRTTKLKSSDIYKVSFGLSLPMNMRASLDLMHGRNHKFSQTQQNEIELLSNSYKVKHNTAMVNVFYDFTNKTALRPYIGWGVGFSNNKTSASSYTSPTTTRFTADKKSTNNFAWDAVVGVAYDVNKSVYLDLSYRYLDLGKVEGGTVRKVSNNTDTIYRSVTGRLRNSVLMFNVGYKF
jgi:opacity protein-like surface antigen